MRIRALSGKADVARAAGAPSGALDLRLAARALGFLYLAGATIGLVSLLLPHPPHADMLGLYSNVGLAYVGAVVLILGIRHLRPWMLHLSVVAGALLITRAVLLSADPDSFYSVWYIWIGLYVFYFCSRPAAAIHVSLVAALYAATLAHLTPTSPVARWLTTVATLVVAGALIDTLVRRARHEASASAASAASMAQITALAHELAALSNGEAARDALCTGAVRVARSEYAALWEPGPEPGLLRASAAAGMPVPVAELALDDLSVPAIGAFTSGEIVTSAGAPSGAAALASLAGAPARFSVWCPIARDGQSVAVLELSWAGAVAALDPALTPLASLLAAEAAVTLERLALLGELEAVARTDELTGLPNRRAWQEQLDRELVRAGRTGENLGVAMIDIDHFKDYNDNHGHQTGDRLLQQVAAAWRVELRATDLLARYGGEEFCLALPARATEDALAVVERLRAAMPGGQTCSAGLAIWDGGESAAQLVDRADHALYGAKRAGRNRSALAGDERPLGEGHPVAV